MSNPSGPTRCLLDKNIIRYAITGLRDGYRRPLSSLEVGALSFWQAAEKRAVGLYISHASFHVLRQMTRYDEVQLVLDSMRVLSPTRYHARWARRLRQTTGLSREDAAMIALGTFSSDQQGGILGMHWLVTYDQAMINGFLDHLPALERRLQAMTVQLSAPFHQAILPCLASPGNILTEWAEAER